MRLKLNVKATSAIKRTSHLWFDHVCGMEEED